MRSKSRHDSGMKTAAPVTHPLVFAFLMLFSCLIGFCAPSILAAQTATAPSKTEITATDLAQEPFVIEQFLRKENFESDGTALREDTARVRIQSEAGLQRYGLLSFSYASGTGTFEIEYVRVRKSDGSVVVTPPDSAQDMPAEITRAAPFYSDLHEKHLAVKGLGVGDVLEFQVRDKTTKPLAPGHFWMEYAFTNDEIVRDEELEIRVPHDRAVKVKSVPPPAIREEGSYRIYSWHHANLTRKNPGNNKREEVARMWRQARGRLPDPDVRLSSFGSWEEVGRWYDGLQADRIKSTTEIAAKAAELTKGAATEEAKIRALYSYVSTQFRYIGVAFGIGRYQPHDAADVLANQYGDCKDKHTLLTSLLRAAGIPAYTALISSNREIDPDVPSPGQFDHVITVVPRDSSLVWLDSTSEVGPYQYLIPPLRDKHALVIWKDKQAALANTPVDLPYPSVQSFRMSAKMDDTATLVGHTEVICRGDVEYLLRAGFRVVPLPQWKDLAQRISYSSGFAGEVSEVTASSPEKTDEPFHYEYKYTRKDFGDWPNRRILAPSPIMALSAPAEEDQLPEGPLWLGALTEVNSDTEVEVPGDYRAQTPEDVHLKKDFAEYDSTYEFKNGKLISNRKLRTLLREVPATEREEYKTFAKSLQDDYGVFVNLYSSTGSTTAVTSNTPPDTAANTLRNLPESSNEEATRLESEARTDFQKHDMQGAITALYRATSADPKFTRAWILLGSALLSTRQTSAGLDAFHKAIASDPTQPAIPKALGMALMSSSQYEDALPIWQDYVKAHPDDVEGTEHLGRTFYGLKRYSEAATAYETAIKGRPGRPEVQQALASSYLLAGDHDKAGDAFGKLGDMKPAAVLLNNSAYEMANANLRLPMALDYATKAVQTVEDETAKITLADLSMKEVQGIFTLSAYWDTLGWVYAQNSNLEQAETYLKAAWKLDQDATVGSHLCDVYKRLHKKALALQACQMAQFRISMSSRPLLPSAGPLNQSGNLGDELAKSLQQLDPGSPKSKDSNQAVDHIIQERTFKLPRFLSGTETAEFFVLFTSDGKSKTFQVEDTKFVSGSDKMKLQGKRLKTIDFGFPAPGPEPTRFVRRGILGCYPYSGCAFVLLDPSAVHSIN